MRKNQQQLVPVNDEEIENAVLGAILLERDAFALVNNMISEEVFYNLRNKSIYKAIVSLFDKSQPIDIMTVTGEIRALGIMEQVGGPYEIVKLTNSVVSSAHIEAHCKILLEYELKRRQVVIGNKLFNEGFDKSIDVFDSINKADNELVAARERVFKGLAKDISYYVSKVYEEYESVKATGVLGVSTGIAEIDRIMCGLVAPDLLMVAARPGQGKSAFAFSIIRNISCDQGIAGAIFNYEMNGTQVIRRLASQLSGVSHESIRRGNIFPHLETQFFQACDQISRAPIYIEDDSNLNIRDIRTRAIILKRKHNIKYIIIDYLQLIPSIDVKGRNREQAVSEISRGLKSLAKELNIPVIALSQLSRAVEARSDKIPQLSDLRESGSLEQDADSVIFLMRPAYYGIVESQVIGGVEYSAADLCIGVIGKNRHGDTRSFAMKFDGPIMRVSNYDTLDSLSRIPASTMQQIANSADANTEDWGDQPFG